MSATRLLPLTVTGALITVAGFWFLRGGTTGTPSDVTAGPAPLVAQAATLPEPPRVYLDTTYTPPTGRTLPVLAGGDFQAALNTAQPGDVITLQAGATFTGPFTLPSKSGSTYIIIRSSTADATLPPPGQRITPAYAAVLPKIRGNPALTAGSGAHHFRFIGVEFLPPAGLSILTLLDLQGTNLIFDRCYIHGDPVAGGRLGVALNGARNAVIDSYLSDWKHTSFDAQAIAGWNAPGPFKIVNNYLEGAGENLIFGGIGDPASAALIPSDIEIRGNYFFKPLSWKVGAPAYAGVNWVVKNLFELKNAHRVLVDGNIFEQVWTGNTNSQGGLAIVFTPRNQYGSAPFSVVTDVTFTHNIVRHATAGFNLLGWDNINASQQLQRVLIQHNLLTNIGEFPDVTFGGFFTGMLALLKEEPADVIIDHNTAVQTGAPLYAQNQAGRPPATGFVFTNNITLNNQGVSGAGTDGNPILTLSTYFPDAKFEGNVIVGGIARHYPPRNFFPASLNATGFVNRQQGDYRLTATSRYKRAGMGGSDPGVDLEALRAALGLMAGRSLPPKK